jgi:hypothetical protein
MRTLPLVCQSALLALTFCVAGLPLRAADKTARAPEATPSTPSQPSVESLDLAMYGRIRNEGFEHSHIMEYASALADDIGPRLTGSPNMAKANAWTRDQLTAMGCANAHLEDWGEFGMGWQQLNTWVRMSSPDTAVFIAQAAPWSPPTMVDGKPGPVSGAAVQITVDFGKNAPPLDTQLSEYKGKLRGKIVLLGETRPTGEVDNPLVERDTEASLDKIKQVPLGPGNGYGNIAEYFAKVLPEKEKLGLFLKTEGVVAVIVPSRDSENHGGSGGTIFDDSNSNFSWFSYQRAHATPVPLAVASIENYGRVTRLLAAHVPVTIEANIEVKFTGDHEHGFDTVAEIPGTDPLLKDQVVMLGGHLDSWISGTGATDNGAGTLVAMEVMRIFAALHVQPRRTIRIGLWSGEEEGIFGSAGYVAQHFGTVPLAGDASIPDFLRDASGPPVTKPEWSKISGYFNVDNGSGRLRGVYTQGNMAIAPIFAQWIAPLADLGVSTITNANTGGTDHLNFDAVGVPGFQFIQDPLDYETRTHHSNMDVYEALRPDDLRQAAVVEAIFVYNTAMRDQLLPRKPVAPQPATLKSVFPGAVEPK